LSHNKNFTVNNNNIIKDVYDGQIFTEFLNSADGQFIINCEGYTFLINTDGIAISLKSNTSIWPVMLVIDQIKIGHRFCLENVIFAGVFFYLNNL
jgi:hypothetical protein